MFLFDISNIDALTKLEHLKIFNSDSILNLTSDVFYRNTLLKKLNLIQRDKEIDIEMPAKLFRNCKNIQEIELKKSTCNLPQNFLMENNNVVKSFYLNFGKKCQEGVSINENAFLNTFAYLEKFSLNITYSSQSYTDIIINLGLAKHDNLKLLELFDNYTSLVVSSSKVSDTLIGLSLDKGPMKCKCDVLEYIKNLDNNTLRYHTKPWLNNYDQSNTTMNICPGITKDCRPLFKRPEFFIPAIIFLIGFLLVFVIAAIYSNRYYFYTNSLWYQMCYSCFPKESNKIETFEYDTFILTHDAYGCECGIENNEIDRDETDNEILSELTHKLENGFDSGRQFSVAYRVRDYIAGKKETENLERLLKTSERTIVLLSKNYINANYHLNELQQVASHGLQNRYS